MGTTPILSAVGHASDATQPRPEIPERHWRIQATALSFIDLTDTSTVPPAAVFDQSNMALDECVRIQLEYLEHFFVGGIVANEAMRTSGGGMADLRRHEGVVMAYYNDMANNCTYGVGTLVHHGLCTAEELQRPVTVEDIDIQLQTRIQRAERAVRDAVAHQQLTQAQFDALVSFVYNVGAGGAAATLAAADRGDSNGVVQHLNQNVYVHPRDARGRRLAPVRVRGLVNRRQDESMPFRQPDQQNTVPPSLPNPRPNPAR